MAERRGADVGERGDERVTRTGCLEGRRGVRATWRSWYRSLSLGNWTEGSGEDNESNA